MYNPAISALGLLTLFLASSAVQEPDVSSPAEELASLLAGHKATELGRVEAYVAFKPKFEAFAKAHRGSEPEARASLWLLQNTWWLRSDGTMESTALPMGKDLLARHGKSPQLGLLVEYQYVFAKAERAPLFKELHAGSPHVEVKAAAQFGLARLFPARGEDGEPNEHYALLLKEYAEVPWRATTFGAIADAYLNPFARENLKIGKQAPEIVGVDEEGEPMKLSDFRGRVVVLDFWGDW